MNLAAGTGSPAGYHAAEQQQSRCKRFGVASAALGDQLAVADRTGQVSHLVRRDRHLRSLQAVGVGVVELLTGPSHHPAGQLAPIGERVARHRYLDCSDQAGVRCKPRCSLTGFSSTGISACSWSHAEIGSIPVQLEEAGLGLRLTGLTPALHQAGQLALIDRLSSFQPGQEQQARYHSAQQ